MTEQKNNDNNFIKENWISMVLVAFSVLGIILSVVWLAEFGGMLTFMAITGTLAWMFFFIGMSIYFTCIIFKFGKKCTCPMIMLGVGIITTLFGFINMIYAFTQIPSEAGNIERIYLFVPLMFPLIVIGFFTLFRGLAETIEAKKNP